MNTSSVVVKIAIAGCILLFACYSDSAATSDLGFKGIGPGLGYVKPGNGNYETAEAGITFEFGEFVPQLHWDGSLSFWSSGRTYSYYQASVTNVYQWKSRDVALRSGVNYHFSVGDWVPITGGGLGLHFYSWDYAGAPNYSNNGDTKLGLYLDGGLEHKFNENLTGKMQLLFDFADPDQTALMFNLIYYLQ